MTSDAKRRANDVDDAESQLARPMRWRRRPLAAWVTRGLVFIVPVAAGIGVAAMASVALPPPQSVGEAAIHWVLLVSVSLAVVLIVDTFSRRLLPLSALLELSLLFPGDAPSRFRVALRAGSVRRLERQFRQAHANNDVDVARYAGLVLSLASSISNHDRKTRGHSERVRAYTELIAESLGVPRDEREKLRWAALLHDVGKLEVPATVLNKDGRPDDGEWNLLRAHPGTGARIAEPLLPWLGRWADTIGQHHERVDGNGYPLGIAGDDICLGARIVAVADAYETMTSARSYKQPVSPAAAREELAACAGTQFDEDVVRAFMTVSVADLRRVMAPMTALLDVPLVRTLSGLTEPVATGVTTTAAVTALAIGGAGFIPAERGGGGDGRLEPGQREVTAPVGTHPQRFADVGEGHTGDVQDPAVAPRRSGASGADDSRPGDESSVVPARDPQDRLASPDAPERRPDGPAEGSRSSQEAPSVATSANSEEPRPESGGEPRDAHAPASAATLAPTPDVSLPTKTPDVPVPDAPPFTPPGPPSSVPPVDVPAPNLPSEVPPALDDVLPPGSEKDGVPKGGVG